MIVGLAGSGTATEAIRATLADAGVDVRSIDPGEIGAVDRAVVVDRVGAAAFAAANAGALEAERGEWIAVELGGIGGHRIETVDTAVSTLAPDGPCFECLRTRVESNVVDGTATTAADDGIDAATARIAGAIAGRRLLGLLDGGGIEDGADGVIELPYAERRLLAVPNCVCERDPDAANGRIEREHVDRSLEATIDRFERALDDRVGIVREIGEAASVPVPYYLARLCNTTPFSDARATPQAAGVAADWNEAFVKALGEALERYCAGVYRIGDFLEAPTTALEEAVPPSAFVLPIDAVDPNEPVRWAAGEALATGDRAYLPAEFVVFPPSAERHRPSITTGLGLGNSPVEALLSGLYEVLERDATMLAWYSTFEPLGLAVESQGFETLRRRARAEGLSVSASLVTQDVDVPVVTVAVHRGTEWPRFAVGSGANLDAAAAARAALAEALQNWTELRDMGRERAADAAGAIGRSADRPSAVEELIDMDRTVAAASVGTGVSDVDALETVIGRLTAAGLEPYAVRLTTRDVEALGFEAVRALVPTAQPLFTGNPFFGERARSVPATLGFEPRLEREFHPYP